MWKNLTNQQYIMKFPHKFAQIDYREFQFYATERLHKTVGEFKYIVGMSVDNSVVRYGIKAGIYAVETTLGSPNSHYSNCRDSVRSQATQELIDKSKEL